MQVATGIWTQHAASHPLMGASPEPMTGPANGNNGPSDPSGSATISANDFLTLLVTEMQNQDPTDQTDPNEYIDQLVQVNSLEQLIDINQNLSTVLGIPEGGSGQGPAQRSPQAAGLAPSTSDGAPAVAHPAAHKASALGQVQSAAAASAATGSAAAHGKAVARSTQGNLGVPEASSAAQRVAHALAGRTAAR